MASKDVVAPRSEQPVAHPEWQGHTSDKFPTNKMHIAGPIIADQGYLNDKGRTHYGEQESRPK